MPDSVKKVDPAVIDALMAKYDLDGQIESTQASMRRTQVHLAELVTTLDRILENHRPVERETPLDQQVLVSA